MECIDIVSGKEVVQVDEFFTENLKERDVQIFRVGYVVKLD